MVGASAGCVWGWLRPRRVDAPGAGQAGCLAKAGTAARRRAGVTIQACTVGASAISVRLASEDAVHERAHLRGMVGRRHAPLLAGAACGGTQPFGVGAVGEDAD